MAAYIVAIGSDTPDHDPAGAIMPCCWGAGRIRRVVQGSLGGESQAAVTLLRKAL